MAKAIVNGTILTLNSNEHMVMNYHLWIFVLQNFRTNNRQDILTLNYIIQHQNVLISKKTNTNYPEKIWTKVKLPDKIGVQKRSSMVGTTKGRRHEAFVNGRYDKAFVKGRYDWNLEGKKLHGYWAVPCSCGLREN